MITTWEVKREPKGDLDEVLVAYAKAIILRLGSLGHWALTIDLAEGGRLFVHLQSAHGIRGEFDIDEISPRCPWLGPLATPLAPSNSARYRVERRSDGRLAGLRVERPNFLHIERLGDGTFWMSISMPGGELLATNLFSAAPIVGDTTYEPAPNEALAKAPAYHEGRLPRLLGGRHGGRIAIRPQANGSTAARPARIGLRVPAAAESTVHPERPVPDVHTAATTLQRYRAPLRETGNPHTR